MPASWSPVQLGRSKLNVVPMGIASSYGLSGRDVERAFERGVDLFYWGSYRRPDFGTGLSRLGARARERMKVVLQSYARSPAGVGKGLEKGLRALRMDHADILLLGWWNLLPRDAVLDAAQEQVRLGRARAVMISCHNRPAFPRMAKDPRIQLLMIRYNAAHPGAEQDIFPHLPEERPGIVTYTATSWGQLLDRRLVPEGEKVPSSTDCYRFVLSNPNVNACWTAPRDGAQLDLALAALDAGPLGDEEMAWMRRVGAVVRERTRRRTAGLAVAERFLNAASGFGFRSNADLARQ